MEKQKRIYIWTLPRSLSGAFLRALTTVEGTTGLNEPYLAPCFIEAQTQDANLPTPFGSTFEEIKSFLQNNFKEHKLLFIKEMPTHFGHRVDDTSYIPRECIHTFLIRHPVKTLTSFINLGLKSMEVLFPDLVTEEERMQKLESRSSPEELQRRQSLKPLLKVYETVTKTYGQKSIVIDADDLQENPEGTLRAYCKAVGIEYHDSMVHWGPITPEQRQVFEPVASHPIGYHTVKGAIEGTEFIVKKPDTATLDDVDEKFRGFTAENISIYEQFRELRIKPIS